MIKYLMYILYLSCLISCFEISKPFENDKITMPVIKAINSGLYISKIIGLSNKTEIELRNRIYNKVLNKNILASYKYFNKNSYILKSSFIKYKSINKNKMIFTLSSPSFNEVKKLDIIIPNNKITNIEIQEQVSSKIAEFIEKHFNKTDKNKIIKINDISGLEENKKLKNIFLNKLSYLFSKQSIEIVNTEKIHHNNNYYYFMDIEFSITEINKEKIKLKVTWLIYDQNKKLIGDIKQENVFLKSLLTKIWPEISSKIIEMSLTEIKILTNVQK
jgi:hypothetical protein